MGIEDGGLVDALIEDVSDEEDSLCPACNDMLWLRVVAVYPRGTCWVLYCGACGRMLQERWNMLP